MTTETLERPTEAPTKAWPQTVEEVGKAAADYIEEFGWAGPDKVQLKDRSKSACAWAAMWAVTGSHDLCDEATVALVEQIGLGPAIPTVSDPAHLIWTWNDDPEREEHEVIAALRGIR